MDQRSGLAPDLPTLPHPSGGTRSGADEPAEPFRFAVENMPLGLCWYDAGNRLRLMNAQFCAIYGQSADRLAAGMHFRDVLADSIAMGNYPGRTADDVWLSRKAMIERRASGVFLQELGDGRVISITHQPLPDGGWIAVYQDVTEQRRDQAQIQFLAQHDVLTLLPNRRFFHERLAQILAAAGAAQPCVLLCLDLDGFKEVNDRFGHAAGDLLLRQAGNRLRIELRADDFAARLGGDEFAAVLPCTESVEADTVAARIIDALGAAYDLEAGRSVQVGVSIGIAGTTDAATAPDTLMRRADAALYEAKRAGKGVWRRWKNHLGCGATLSEAG